MNLICYAEPNSTNKPKLFLGQLYNNIMIINKRLTTELHSVAYTSHHTPTGYFSIVPTYYGLLK